MPQIDRRGAICDRSAGSYIPTSPRRNASFTSCLRGLSIARRRCSIWAATSSSSERVVLMHHTMSTIDVLV